MRIISRYVGGPPAGPHSRPNVNHCQWAPPVGPFWVFRDLVIIFSFALAKTRMCRSAANVVISFGTLMSRGCRRIISDTGSYRSSTGFMRTGFSSSDWVRWLELLFYEIVMVNKNNSYTIWIFKRFFCVQSLLNLKCYGIFIIYTCLSSWSWFLIIINE